MAPLNQDKVAITRYLASVYVRPADSDPEGAAMWMYGGPSCDGVAVGVLVGVGGRREDNHVGRTVRDLDCGIGVEPLPHPQMIAVDPIHKERGIQQESTIGAGNGVQVYPCAQRMLDAG